MALAPERKAELLRELIASEVWKAVLEPMLQARLQAEIQGLIQDSHSGSRRFGALSALTWFSRMARLEERRGFISSLQQLIAWPVGQLAQYDLDKLRENAQNEDEARYRWIAEYGHTIPYLPPAEDPTK